MQHVENELDQTIEKLSSTNTKFDEKDKAFQLAEGESQALSRKLVLEEAEFERTESTLVTITAELTEKSNLADTINKAIKVLETKNMIDEERIDLLENQVKEAKQMVEESDIKYDEVARKLGMISHKKSLITIFGHKHKIKNFIKKFDFFFFNSLQFWFLLGIKLGI